MNPLNLLLKDLKSDDPIKHARAQEYCKSVNNQIPLTHKEVHYPQPHLNDNLSEVSKQIRDDLTSEDLARIQYAQWQQKELNKQLKRSDAERYVGMLIKETTKLPDKIGEYIPRIATKLSTRKDSYKSSQSLDEEIDKGTNNYTVPLSDREKKYVNGLDILGSVVRDALLASRGLRAASQTLKAVEKFDQSNIVKKHPIFLEIKANMPLNNLSTLSNANPAASSPLKRKLICLLANTPTSNMKTPLLRALAWLTLIMMRSSL